MKTTTSHTALQTVLIATSVAALACSGNTVSLGENEEALDIPEHSRCSESTTLEGDTVVRSQAEINELEGCEVIDGDLRVVTFPDIDLRPLHRLHTVDGNLHLTDPDEERVPVPARWLDSLEGLESLRQVNGLYLRGVTVADLAPLQGVSGRLEFLTVADCPQLHSFAGLEGITGVDGVAITNNESLESLSGLSLGSVMDVLELVVNPSLDSLGTEPPLSVENLVIVDNAFTNLDDFASMEHARALWIVQNSRLVNIHGLGDLLRVRILRLAQNPVLSELPPFSRLSNLTQLTVLENESLTTLPIFPSIHPISEEEPVYHREGLINRPEVIEIEGNPRLESFEAPEGWHSATYVSIVDNASLTRVAMSNMSAIDWLQIRGNANLSVVDVPALQTVDRLSVENNPELPTSSLEEVQSYDKQLADNADD